MSENLIWDEGNITISQCVTCAHKNSSAATCAAFPDGIPNEILTNEFDHKKPYRGDNDIQYKKKGKK